MQFSLEDSVNDEFVAINISAGKSHAGAVIKRRSPVSQDDFEHALYMWGSNKYGQLGLGDFESKNKPTETIIKYGQGGNESSDTLTVSVKDQ